MDFKIFYHPVYVAIMIAIIGGSWLISLWTSFKYFAPCVLLFGGLVTAIGIAVKNGDLDIS